MASQLKYLSIKDFICGPNFQISAATRKKRAPLLIIDAIMNIIILILNAPEEIVITLYGSGVNPAVNMIQKSYSTYSFWILKNASGVKLGMLLKKNFAISVKSFDGVHQRKWPIKYPNNAPRTEPIRQIEANLNAFLVEPSTKAISKASGGTGKNDDSANANINSAVAPYGVSDQ